MRKKTTHVDFCVVGGGMAGLIAAVAAARHGAKVALVHDRPVFGGNASSEIRMHICGAHGPNKRETGILEEIQLENNYRNPQVNFSVWDSVLYGLALQEPNLRLFLNCSINDATMDGNRITSVIGWQMTTETWHTIEATLFADCSGDGILAPLSGAEYRIGREAQNEYDESIAPKISDKKTMGMTCLMQAREMDCPQTYTPPTWANVYPTDDDLRGRGHSVLDQNYWWMELGGEADSIHDTEILRTELLKMAFGIWDHMKNHGDHGAENWTLEWVGFLPGKRESRRYIGDHVLSQKDVEGEGRFQDIVAYGGWSMDDHFPAGFLHPEAGTIFHPAPSPFGIPYRTLYSRNIANLFCAGRNHSATHTAMSSTRVMATTSLMGQAVGTAAALAVQHGTTPRGVYEHHLLELQQTLMDDDCYLPWNTRAVPELTRTARLEAEASESAEHHQETCSVENLRNGVDRPIGETSHGWCGALGKAITYTFEKSSPCSEARMIFDSDLNRKDPCRMFHEREMNTRHCRTLTDTLRTPPATLIKAFRIEGLANGSWHVLAHETNNYQRLVKMPLAGTFDAIRLIPETTWGADEAHLFAFDVR